METTANQGDVVLSTGMSPLVIPHDKAQEPAIAALVAEYQALVYPPGTIMFHLGPDQLARASKRQSNQIERDLLRGHDIIAELRKLLRDPKDVAADELRRLIKTLEAETGFLRDNIADIERIYTNSRTGKIPADIRRAIAKKTAKLAELDQQLAQKREELAAL